MAARARKPDLALADIARRQHGVVAREQLLAAGFTRHTVQRRIDCGVLDPVHSGVYLVLGAGDSPLALESAAVLACRPRALLSHRTAARLWDLPVPAGGPIEVTVAGRSRRSLAHVRVYSLSALPRAELRTRHRLPLASPSLTILDLAGLADAATLAGALNEARVQRIVSDSQLRATIAHHPRRRGARALRRLLDREGATMITRSEAERRALEAMREHGIPPDSTDVQIGSYRVDFLFRRERLVVEVDGYRYHSTPERFVGDRRRSADLAARGLAVFPLTWTDLGEGRERAMRRLEQALEQRRMTFAGRVN